MSAIFLEGQGGNDAISGGGNDSITGGTALDTLTGGRGNDAVGFTAQNSALDTATDWKNGDDADFPQITGSAVGGLAAAAA